MGRPATTVSIKLPDIRDALALHQNNRLDEAEKTYRSILAANPRHFDALHLLGVLCTQQTRYDEAVVHLSKALKINARSFDANNNLGNVFIHVRRFEDAIAYYRRALQIDSKSSLIRNNLGVALHEAGRFDDAILELQRVIAKDPQYADAHYNLGRTLAAKGQYEDAISNYHRAIQIKPQYVEAWVNLGAAFLSTHRYADAIAPLRNALSLRPTSIEALSNLGVALHESNTDNEAVTLFQQALSLCPQYAEAHSNLGNVMKDLRRFDEAAQYYRQALAIKPDYADAWNNLGNVLSLQNRHEEAVACYRKALAIRPDFADAHSYLIFTTDFLPDANFADQQAERARWYRDHGVRFAPAKPVHLVSPDPERRLRIGYVSADFRRHSAALTFGPIIRNHDRERFDVVLYSNVKKEDDLTREFESQSSLWRRTISMSDDTLADTIQNDQIDILVDLSGHTEGNRLLAFARKPAPIQMTAWGHALGTGLKTIDCFLADPIAVPMEVRPLFAEKIIDLPSILTYEAPAYAPVVVEAPSLSTGRITFGSFNRISKLTTATLDVWSRLMKAVPNACLILKDGQLSDAGERRRMTALLESHGIELSRLTLMPGTPHADHLAAYGQMDIALDPFPTNGGVTTAEALLMGVPVVALQGASVSSRISASILTAVGLGDWVADNPDQYLELAIRRAGDIQGLAEIRRKVRPLLQASPVGDPAAYCRAVEQAYRRAWRSCCRLQIGQA